MQYTRGDDPFIVESILSRVCYKEFEANGKCREFDYDILVKLIQRIKSPGWRRAEKYEDTVTQALVYVGAKRSEYTVLRHLASEYFKAVKKAHPLDGHEWEITVDTNTREITLYHYPTMTRSESLYTLKHFDLGSVTVEGRPCRHRQQLKLHAQMGRRVVYEIASGRKWF
jgi:hypothetical protein